MTNIVSTAAYIQVCRECGKHGMLITTSGQESLHFASKETALEAIEFGRSLGLITEEEVLALLDQLGTLRLQERSCQHTEALEALINDTCDHEVEDVNELSASLAEDEDGDEEPEEPPPTIH